MSLCEVATPCTREGVANIKSEYIFKRNEEDTDKLGPGTKKQKLEEDGKKPKKNRGQFKNRFKINRVGNSRSQNLCRILIDVKPDQDFPKCAKENCVFGHDVVSYMNERAADIGETCYVFTEQGHCPRGLTCLYSKNHITPDFKNIENKDLKEKFSENGFKTHNYLSYDLQNQLKKHKYNFKRADDIIKIYSKNKNVDDENLCENKKECEEEKEEINENEKEINENETEEINGDEKKEEHQRLGPCSFEDLIKLRSSEKKTINWKDKLYLSPLTTLGNLPFRRICKEFGADITCGEMAMASSILKGLPYEWALLKHHDSENLFGVQLCDNNARNLTKAAQLIEENTNVQFIDINLGCPIDTVYRRGGGSALLRRNGMLETVITSMTSLLNIPLTVKTRTGVYADKNVAHKFMPLYSRSGVSLVTVHGRSREQRYTRRADWSYINECAKLADPVPVFGNGDILSYHDYVEARQTYSHVSGAMIGRGALYKPWIFTEIKEQRDWDISSLERLDLLKKFVNYGMENWGSDAKGVEVTRKFLLEWLSFLYRYIPVALLEHPPQKINERPPRYVGRNDLETLMASPNCSDWVKISEMLLGPVPENFQFLPKHKANSWAD